jgi:hypothetical protein
MKFYLLVLTAALFVSSCSSSEESKALASGTTVGSYFQYSSSVTDKFGIPQETGTSELYVDQNNLAIGGRSNVVAMNVTVDRTVYTQPEYYFNNPNGDLEYWSLVKRSSRGDTSFWVNFPFGSQQTAHYSYFYSRFNDTVDYSFDTRYMAESSVQVAGKTFATKVIENKGRFHGSIPYEVLDFADTIEYSPELKVVVKERLHETDRDANRINKDSYTTKLLTNYGVR